MNITAQNTAALVSATAVSDPIVNAFTIDVEDYFHVEAFSKVISRDSWADREYRCERNTSRILQLLDDHKVRGTFFVLGWVTKRSPQLVRDIAAAGHEVACHGMSHKLIYKQTREEFREETRSSKKLLEDLLGKPVHGYRAASFSIVKSSLWALDELLDAGFQYDSSVFPVHHDNYGIPGAELQPYEITAPSGRTLLEFPMTVARFGRFRLPVSGGGYFRIFPYWLTRNGLARVNQRDRRPFVFYLHPWEIDNEQPRIDAGLKSRLRHYTNLASCEGRLHRLLSEFSFAPMRNVLAASPIGARLLAQA
jgi:polysaccharide deacetylase family protein (PEP-CTERM system associated)